MQSKTLRIVLLVVVVLVAVWFVVAKSMGTDLAQSPSSLLAATGLPTAYSVNSVFTITPGLLKATAVRGGTGVPDVGVYVLQYTLKTGSNVGGIRVSNTTLENFAKPGGAGGAAAPKTIIALTETSTSGAIEQPKIIKNTYSTGCKYNATNGLQMGANASCTVTFIVQGVAKMNGNTGLRLTQMQYQVMQSGKTIYDPPVVATSTLFATIKTPDIQLANH